MRNGIFLAGLLKTFAMLQNWICFVEVELSYCLRTTLFHVGTQGFDILQKLKIDAHRVYEV